MDSWKNNECAFIFTCCGCVPFVGAIKGALLLGPVLVVFTLLTTLISIILVPHDILLTYFTLLRTDTIGPNLKLLGFLLLPVPLVLTVPITLLGSILFSIGLGLFYPLGITFNRYCDGWNALSYAFKFAGDYWDMHYHTYFNYLSELRTPHSGAPWDINFCQVFVGLFIAAIGSVFVGLFVTILAVLKLVPAIFRGWWYLIKFFWFDRAQFVVQCACFPVWLIALAVWPVIAVLSCAICSLGGMGAGAYCAVVAYQDGFSAGFQTMYLFVFKFDDRSNQFLGIGDSCFPEVSVTPRRPPDDLIPRDIFQQNRTQGSMKNLVLGPKDSVRIPTTQIWDLFFEMAPLHVEDALAEGMLTKNDLERIESNRMPQRIAAVVYFGVLDRSSTVAMDVFHTLREVVGLGPDRIVLEYTGGVGVLVLSNGLNLDESNRPLDPLANVLYPTAISLCHGLTMLKMAPSNSLTFVHVKYIKQVLLAPSMEKPPAPPVSFSETETNACVAMAKECMAAGSRAAAAPTYLRRLRFSLRKFTSSFGGPQPLSGGDLV